MTKIQEHDLDAAIPAAPLLPSVESTLRAGQGALRRRRQGMTTGLIAIVSVVVALAAGGLVGGGTGNDRIAVPADQASDVLSPPTVSTTPPLTVPSGQLLRNQDPIFDPGFSEEAMYDYDGVLLIRPGVEVQRRWDNPMNLGAPAKSVAMIVTNAGKTYWVLVAFEGDPLDTADGTMWSSSIEPRQVLGFPFERWVQDETALSDIAKPAPDLVHLQADGTLKAVNGATILAQTSEVPARVVPPQADAATVGWVQIGPAELCVYAAQASGRDPEYLYLAASMWGPDLAGCISTMPGWNLRP